MQAIRDYASAHRDRFVKELVEFLRFPSVSTDPAHAKDLVACCDWVVRHLKGLGLDVQVDKSGQHAHVLARSRNFDRTDLPHLLIYGHYDVQPPDPLNEWKSPPFEPTIRGKDVFARGASDNKGQIFAHMKGVEAMLKAGGGLPVRVTLLVEGEEEIGSPSLAAMIRARKSELASDAILISDCDQLAPGRPAILYGLRGLAAAELRLKGPSRDVHSGTYGGSIRNPIHELCSIVAGLHDADGRVNVPGFYNDVRPVQDWERENAKTLAFDEKAFLHEAGVDALHGEKGFTTLERRGARPTVEINGIYGGYQGAGSKTVLPAAAGCKITCRLVPDQDPGRILDLLEARIRELTPRGVRATFERGGGAKAMFVPKEGPLMEVAVRAVREGFGAEPVFMRMGGSIPVTSYFEDILEQASILIGFALPDDGHHSPNEKFHLPELERGILTSCAFMKELAAAESRV